MGHAPLATSIVLAIASPLAWAAAQDAPPPQPPPPPQAPQDAPAAIADTQVDWAPSFAEALRIARETRRPVFVAFNMDHEVANDAMVRDVYENKKFVEKSRQFVCVIGSIGDHAQKANASGQPECTRFGRVTCAAHKECEMRAREALLEGNVVIAPQHVICTADGNVLARRAWQMSLEETLKWMDRGLKRVTGAAPAAPAEVKAEKERIRAIFEQAERVRSWQKGEYVQQVQELEDDLANEALATYVLKGKDDETRVAILARLGISGDYTSIELLKKAARDRKPYVALAAVDAMGRTRLPELKDDLKKLLGSFTAGNDYGRVLRAYAACGRDDKDVRDLVLKKAKGSDQNVRAHALVALGTMASAPEIEECLRKTASDPLTVARACAVWAIGMGRYKECRKELERLMQSEPVADLKDLAFAALAHLDHDPADKNCCALEGKIYRFVTLGETRR